MTQASVPATLTSLLLADDLFPAVMTGAKTGTLRTGHRDIGTGALALCARDGTLPDLLVEVDRVLHARLADLPDWAIAMEGCRDLDQVLAGLRAHYPTIQPDSPVTAVYWSRWRFRAGIAATPGLLATAGLLAP